MPIIVTEMTLMNSRAYATAASLAPYSPMNGSRRKCTAMPERMPRPRKMTCVVREYSRIFSIRPEPTVLPVIMPTALERPFIAMYIMLCNIFAILTAAMTPAS